MLVAWFASSTWSVKLFTTIMSPYMLVGADYLIQDAFASSPTSYSLHPELFVAQMDLSNTKIVGYIYLSDK